MSNETEFTTIEKRFAKALPGWVVVEWYKGGKGGTLVSDQAVSPETCQMLERMGWLAWQVRGLPKPEDKPATAKEPSPQLPVPQSRSAPQPTARPSDPLATEHRKPALASPPQVRPLLPAGERKRQIDLPEVTAHSAPRKRAPDAPQELTVAVWDTRSQRYATKTVSLEEYARLWDQKLLSFQKMQHDKPSHYPSREQVEEWLAPA